MRSGSFSVLALSAVFCLAGLLLLSSCEDQNEAELMEMRGFFLSIDEVEVDGVDTLKIDCGYENADVYLKGDESTGKLDVEIVSTTPTFPDSEVSYKGTKVIRNKGGNVEKVMVASFVIESGDGNIFPSTFNVVSRTDDEIGDGATIFTGYWNGEAVRPEGNPVVMCPYVLVPREALSADSCGGEGTPMAEGLRKYLGNPDNPTELGNCYRQLTDEGRLSPMVIGGGN